MINVLIADDEKIIREGLKKIITRHSDRYNVLDLAEDGLAAIEIAKQEYPHIVITDIRMPNASGLEFLKWLNDNDRKTKTIILSGYEDVEYLRECLRLNVSDYLLKPVNKEQLVGLMDKLADELEQNFKDAETNHILRKAYAKLNEDFLNRLITGCESESRIADFFKNNITFNDNGYRVAIVGVIDNKIKEIPDELSLMNYAVKNIFEELLSENGFNYIGFFSNNDKIIFIIEDSNSDTFGILNKIKNKVYSVINQTLAIGVSSEVSGITNASVAYDEAWSSYCNVIFSQGGIWEYPGFATEEGSILAEYSDKLIKCLEKLNREKYIDCVNEFFKEVFIKENPKYVYSFFDVFFDKLKFSIANKHILGTITSFDANEVKKIEDISSIKGYLVMILDEFFAETKRTFENTISRKVFETKKYIDQNYFKNISLNQTAKELNLSPSYFSELFKKQVGVTFGDYITTVRIARAKELLADVDLTINQVSEMVGYVDRSYFSKVFKKVVGMTPQQYQNSAYFKQLE